jgi:hypothetical protein
MSLTFAQAAQSTPGLSTTANGMVTLDHSGDPATTLFFAIGSSRGKDLTGAFARAYAAEPDVAMKILFWARDAREGAGERETFRKILQNLEITQVDSLMKNLALVPEHGRWDDLLVFTTPTVKLAAYDVIARALRAGNGLAGKWMPRRGPIANELRKYLNYTPKAYRQLLVSLTKVVEQQMCAREWDQINYSHVPSVASSRYMKAFTKHDKDRYQEWKEGLKDGTTKVNSSVLYPYDVIKSVNYGDRDVALAQWEALPNYLGDDKILPMVDVSGSMSCSVGGQKGVGLTCMDVAISLGLYIADKQQGAFKDCWLTFTGDSRIDVLQGDLLSKMSQFRRNVGYDTNIESAFRSILQLATQNNLSADEMPKYLLVLSDMEFNPAWAGGVSLGAFDLAKTMFEAAGYELPKLVWWNLNARPDAIGNSPVRFDQRGTAMVSGFSPSIMKSILAAKNFTPRDIMLETVITERYRNITA